MKNRLLNKRASIYEYTILIVIVIGAIIVMQPYFARGIMGRWKDAGDSFGFGRQYDPGVTVVTEPADGDPGGSGGSGGGGGGGGDGGGGGPIDP